LFKRIQSYTVANFKAMTGLDVTEQNYVKLENSLVEAMKDARKENDKPIEEL